MRRLKLLFLIFVITTFVVMNAFASNNKISSHLRNGFGRIVFDWDDLAAHRIRTEGNVVEIAFNRPFLGDPNSIISSFGGYLDSARISDDKSTIFFNMRRPFPVRSFVEGKKIVLDFLGKPAPTTFVAKNQSNKSKNNIENMGSLLGIRTGVHDGFFRFAFDFDKVPEYDAKKGTPNTEIFFRTNAIFNPSSLAKKLPKDLDQSVLKATQRNGGLDVVLPNNLMRHFKIRNSIVVDVIYDNKILESEAPKPIISPIETVVSEKLAPIEQSIDAAQDFVGLGETNTLEEDIPEEETIRPFADISGDTEFKPFDIRNEPDLYPPARIVSLSFPWNRQTGAAVFRRNGYIWVVFDTKQVVDFTMMMRLSGDVIKDMIQVPHSKGTIIRMLTLPDFNPSVRREGLLWVVDLMKQPVRPQRRVEALPITDSPDGAKLFFPARHTSPMISIVDPEVGDAIFVVPFFEEGMGVFPEKKFVDVRFLETVQGIAAEPLNDYLMARTSVSGVEFISPPQGLSLSRDVEHFAAMVRLDDKDSISKKFDLRRWIRGGDTTFNHDMFALNNLVALVPPDKKNTARLELARFYIAHNMAADALGVLKNIEIDSPDMVNQPEFLAARGMANFLMNRYAEAVDDLGHKALANEDEAVFWRAAAEASIGAPEKQLNALKLSSSTIKDYPLPVKTMLSFVGVRAALAAEDDLATQNFLEAAYNNNLSNQHKAAHAYYRARWNEMVGNLSSAIYEYQNSMDVPDRKYSALAAMDLINIQLKVKSMNYKDAAAELEKLRMAWRGDSYEMNLFKQMAEFYLQDENYFQALNSLKEGSQIFSGTIEAAEMKNRMQTIFEDLFLGNNADDLSPIKALAIYSDFKDLVPKGDEGSQIIRKLADRLVAVDLLDQAANLLEEQIKDIKDEKEQSLLGSRVALIRLMNREPEKALDIITKTENQNLSPLLDMRRNHLKAKALADLNKNDEAISLLQNDNSQEGILLQAEIYWSKKLWDDAADTIKRLVKKPEINQPMEDSQAKIILDWATALRMAGRDRVITRLRHNFGPFIKSTPYWNAFNLITSGKDNAPTGIGDISQQVEEAENFKSFMSDYLNRNKDEVIE